MVKIIVLTPVKNEDWILETFLRITSEFADHILIADQNSKDNSLKVCEKFNKVSLIQNDSKFFNESERQILLINTARKLFGHNNLLLALDADEIIAYNRLNKNYFDLLKQKRPGTVIFIEKPDLFKTPGSCIRYPNNYFPIGFVDDGSIIKTKKIHSTRIPIPQYSEIYNEDNLKLLHFGLVNMQRQEAKVRYYSVVEAVLKTKNVLIRREWYNPLTETMKREATVEIVTTPPEWLAHFDSQELEKVSSSYFYMWYYEEILKNFEMYGCKKFWGDNIWDVDWDIEKEKYGFIKLNISPPPLLAVCFFDGLLFLKKTIKKLIRK